jgi:hypothetical protein
MGGLSGGGSRTGGSVGGGSLGGDFGTGGLLGGGSCMGGFRAGGSFGDGSRTGALRSASTTSSVRIFHTIIRYSPFGGSNICISYGCKTQQQPASVFANCKPSFSVGSLRPSGERYWCSRS